MTPASHAIVKEAWGAPLPDSAPLRGAPSGLQENRLRSPEGAQRNPGSAPRQSPRLDAMPTTTATLLHRNLRPLRVLGNSRSSYWGPRKLCKSGASRLTRNRTAWLATLPVTRIEIAYRHSPARRQPRSSYGARGRNRTGMTVRSRDFLATSTFVASAAAVRGLEHAFTVALAP